MAPTDTGNAGGGCLSFAAPLIHHLTLGVGPGARHTAPLWTDVFVEPPLCPRTAMPKNRALVRQHFS